VKHVDSVVAQENATPVMELAGFLLAVEVGVVDGGVEEGDSQRDNPSVSANRKSRSFNKGCTQQVYVAFSNIISYDGEFYQKVTFINIASVKTPFSQGNNITRELR
jgi:hypothetical protein